MEVIVTLLKNAMDAALEEGRAGDGWADGKGRFLLDGFPRKMDQALKFDSEVKSVHRSCWTQSAYFLIPGLPALLCDILSSNG